MPTVYPRARGGKRSNLERNAATVGLSPCARERGRWPPPRFGRNRFIPARAGGGGRPLRSSSGAWVYPRARGEAGLGALESGHQRFIPARAGEGADSLSAGTMKKVYPRARGGRRRVKRSIYRARGLSPRARGRSVVRWGQRFCRYTRILTDCQPSCVIGRCQILCVMASQSRLRRRQAMTGFGSWRMQAEDTVSIRVYFGGCCQVSCVMAAGKSLLWLVSCQHSCVIVLSIRVYPQVSKRFIPARGGGAYIAASRRFIPACKFPASGVWQRRLRPFPSCGRPEPPLVGRRILLFPPLPVRFIPARGRGFRMSPFEVVSSVYPRVRRRLVRMCARVGGCR